MLQCDIVWQCHPVLHNVTMSPSVTQCNNVTQCDIVTQCDNVTQCCTMLQCHTVLQLQCHEGWPRWTSLVWKVSGEHSRPQQSPGWWCWRRWRSGDCLCWISSYCYQITEDDDSLVSTCLRSLTRTKPERASLSPIDQNGPGLAPIWATHCGPHQSPPLSLTNTRTDWLTLHHGYLRSRDTILGTISDSRLEHWNLQQRNPQDYLIGNIQRHFITTVVSTMIIPWTLWLLHLFIQHDFTHKITCMDGFCRFLIFL